MRSAGARGGHRVMTLGAAGAGTREHRAAERLAGEPRVVNDNDHNNRDFRQFEITAAQLVLSLPRRVLLSREYLQIFSTEENKNEIYRAIYMF